jgi:hypothetical protein
MPTSFHDASSTPSTGKHASNTRANSQRTHHTDSTQATVSLVRSVCVLAVWSLTPHSLCPTSPLFFKLGAAPVRQSLSPRSLTAERCPCAP